MEQEEIIVILKNTYPFMGVERLNSFLQHCQYQRLAKKKILIQQGQNTKKAFFTLSGMVRGYFINQHGEEKNIFLRPEHTVTGAPESLFYNQPTRYTFETVLASEFLFFDFPTFQNLARENADFFQLYTMALSENLSTLIGRVEGLINHTPEERYDQLIEQSPQFFQKALSKHVANYLGITPNSLSRIIARKTKS